MRIPGYERYDISQHGIVTNHKGQQLLGDLNSTGYRRVTLSKDGVAKRFFVHRLLAEVYLGMPEDKSWVVNHIDGDITNNSVHNLEWATMSYNVKDGFKRGRKVKWALSPHSIILIEELRLAGLTTGEVASFMDVHRTTVQRIMRKYNAHNV